MYTMTAAHKSLPLPTFARVTNLRNNRSIVVRINDRGPFVDDRLIDLSYAAAAKLDMLAAGTARVRVQALSSVPGETIRTVPDVASEPYKLPYKVPQPILSGPTVVQQPSPDVSGTTLAGTTLAQRAPSLTNGHYLQLGAFGNFDAAGEMKSRVDPALPVAVFVAKQSDSELYRVQAGPFATLERLTTIKQQLMSQFAIDAIPLLRDEASPICC
jgi:rare lipoprotein A